MQTLNLGGFITEKNDFTLTLFCISMLKVHKITKQVLFLLKASVKNCLKVAAIFGIEMSSENAHQHLSPSLSSQSPSNINISSTNNQFSLNTNAVDITSLAHLSPIDPPQSQEMGISTLPITELENDFLPNNVIDSGMNSDSGNLQNQTKFRRGWAASASNGSNLRSFYSSLRSNESVLKKYRDEYSRGKTETSDQFKEEHPNRPSGARWRQQTLPAWQPIYSPLNVVPMFVGFGVLLISIGTFMFLSTSKTREIIYDYTFCTWEKNSSQTCAEVLEKKLLTPGNSKCVCKVDITVEEDMPTPVYIYYNLNGFYQNHRRYVSSVDHWQLWGKDVSLSTLRSNCAPYATDGDKPYAPCGTIANSFFTDKFALKRNNSRISIKEIDIAWIIDKKYRFRNPPFGFSNTVKPVNWTISVDKLDPEVKDNNGYQNEHLIVWMRTAAFSDFRKLWGRIEPESIDRDSSILAKGSYTIEIEYNYPTVYEKLNIPKKFIISNTSWLGGRNFFLPILYLVIGGLSVLMGLIFIITVFFQKRKINQFQIRSEIAQTNNYQTMATTDGMALTRTPDI